MLNIKDTTASPPYWKNPFQPEAVITYGSPLATTYKNLQYITQVMDHLYLYQQRYTTEEEGATIGILGAHGSGKTHLLSYISEKVSGTEKLPGKVLYAKTDSSSFFDLYKQLVCEKTLPREQLIELINQAVMVISREFVNKAKVTEAIESRIQTKEDIVALHKEGNLDMDEIYIELQARMKKADIPEDIASMLLSVRNPAYGKSAYNWIIGADQENLSDLGINYKLRQTKEENNQSVDPDNIAITALEAICLLYKIAQIPLILMIDQFEGLILNQDPERQKGLSSLIKKLIEQTNRQHALLFIAGNPRSWEVLPRDVSHRLRGRAPLTIGQLTFDEADGLLLEYFKDSRLPSTLFFKKNVEEKLFELSGGTPREVIRIAFYVFELTGGDLSRATEQDVLQASQDSGTVEDKKTIALEMADKVLKEFGEVVSDINIQENITLNRLLKINGEPVLALATVTALDQIHEVGSALKLQAILEHLSRQWPGLKLITLAIGYSSQEIHAKLQAATSIIKFSEDNFVIQLRTEILKAEPGKKPSPQEVAQNTAINATVFESIRSLEDTRTIEVQKTAARLDKKFGELMSEETLRKESKTKWEIEEKIDGLEKYLKNTTDLDMERRIIRSILISNEIYFRNQLVDRLGESYLDIVSAQEYYDIPNRTRDSSFPFEVDGLSHMINRTKDFKFGTLALIRKELRKPRPWEWVLRSPVRFISISTITILLILFAIRFSTLYPSEYLHFELQSFIYYTLTRLSLFALLTSGALYLCAWYLSRRRSILINHEQKDLKRQMAMAGDPANR